MRMYRNGDLCPCCGQTISGQSEKDLEWMSMIFDMLRLPPWEANARPNTAEVHQ